MSGELFSSEIRDDLLSLNAFCKICEFLVEIWMDEFLDEIEFEWLCNDVTDDFLCLELAEDIEFLGFPVSLLLLQQDVGILDDMELVLLLLMKICCIIEGDLTVSEKVGSTNIEPFELK
ncbi:unnamed protein product [[Candida] boidinii]|nr:unnamed protein product [[Candida] boidinii]